MIVYTETCRLAADIQVARILDAIHSPRMETSLAIYEALIQASVPPPAARRVAECLEKDMTSNLATKSDFMLLRQELEHLGQAMATRFEALDARFAAIDARFATVDMRFEAMDKRFEAMDKRFDTQDSRLAVTLQNMEARLVMKLGALMVALFGLMGTVVKLIS